MGLDRTMFGRGPAPHLTEFMVGRGRPTLSGPLDGAGRRSVYLNVRRNFLSPLFLAFDYPIPFTTIGRRSISNVPAQALTMLNNPLVIQQSRRWAERLCTLCNAFRDVGIGGCAAKQKSAMRKSAIPHLEKAIASA